MQSKGFFLHGTYLRKTLQILASVFDWLYFTHCLTSFSFIDLLLFLCTVFDSISSNKDAVLSINPSDNVFVFGEFNIHHKGWLTYPGRTDRPGELCYISSISNDLTQIVKFSTRTSDSDSHIPAFSDFFLSSDTSIFLECLSLHWEIRSSLTYLHGFQLFVLLP